MNIHDITKQIRAFADELDAAKAPKQPLGPQDVTPGSVLLSSSGGVNGMQWTQVFCVKSRGVEINGRDCITWAELKEHWKINRPKHRDADGNPTLWEACEK